VAVVDSIRRFLGASWLGSNYLNSSVYRIDQNSFIKETFYAAQKDLIKNIYT
jgi:hypothetical protein